MRRILDLICVAPLEITLMLRSDQDGAQANTNRIARKNTKPTYVKRKLVTMRSSCASIFSRAIAALMAPGMSVEDTGLFVVPARFSLPTGSCAPRGDAAVVLHPCVGRRLSPLIVRKPLKSRIAMADSSSKAFI